MLIFKFNVSETLTREVEISANNDIEAFEKLDEMMCNDEIYFDRANDFDSSNVDVLSPLEVAGMTFSVFNTSEDEDGDPVDLVTVCKSCLAEVEEKLNNYGIRYNLDYDFHNEYIGKTCSNIDCDEKSDNLVSIIFLNNFEND